VKLKMKNEKLKIGDRSGRKTGGIWQKYGGGKMASTPMFLPPFFCQYSAAWRPRRPGFYGYLRLFAHKKSLFMGAQTMQTGKTGRLTKVARRSPDRGGVIPRAARRTLADPENFLFKKYEQRETSHASNPGLTVGRSLIRVRRREMSGFDGVSPHRVGVVTRRHAGIAWFSPGAIALNPALTGSVRPGQTGNFSTCTKNPPKSWRKKYLPSPALLHFMEERAQ
jgi:hypothetical protein